MASGVSWQKVQHRQRRALGRYLRDEVHAFSPHYRPALEKARLQDGKLASLDDLRRLPLTRFGEVDPSEVVLRPTEDRILKAGRWRLRWGAVVAKVANRPAAVNRLVIEPSYKPIHWQIHDGFPVGYSSEDLDRLAEAGRHWLELAGVRRADVVLSLLSEGPNLAFWELALGARRAGVALVALPPGTAVADLATLAPSVIAGEPDELLRTLLEAQPDPTGLSALSHVNTVLVAGEVLDDARRDRIEALRPGAAVVNAFAPPGVRSLWVECRNGRALHVDVDAEVIEVLDGESTVPVGDVGDVVWTGIGWSGTVLLRLATGMRAALHAGACPACDRHGARLFVEPPPSLMVEAGAVLDEHPEIVAWCPDLESGGDRAVVALRDRRRVRRVLVDLAQAVPDVDIVVATRTEVEALRHRTNGSHPTPSDG